MTTSLPSVRSTVPWTKLPDGAVLFSPDTEVYYAMNGVAAAIWELLSQNKYNFDELCAALSERFPDATPEDIRGDIIEFLDDLAHSGLVDSAASESST
jgi:hypothetical protein